MGIAKKYDNDKPRTDLLPTKALMAIASIYGFGAAKYDEWNWANGFKWSRLYGAVLRHLFAWSAGETLDSESNKSHLLHAACGLLMLIEHEIRNIGKDDRYDWRREQTED